MVRIFQIEGPTELCQISEKKEIGGWYWKSAHELPHGPFATRADASADAYGSELDRINAAIDQRG